MKQRVALSAAVLALAYTLVHNWRDLVRYIKIRRM